MEIKRLEGRNDFNGGHIVTKLLLKKDEIINYGCVHQNSKIGYFCKDYKLFFCIECKDEAVKHLTEHHCKGGLYAVEIEVSE